MLFAKKLAIITIFCLSPSLINSQIKRASYINTGEKLYLHTDKTTYFAGEEIWFKGYLFNANPDSTIENSRFIYVELRGDNFDNKIKIKLRESGFTGSFKIPYTLKRGLYILRAYTKWMQNFPNNYIFAKEIPVITPSSSQGNNTPVSKSLNKGFTIRYYPEGGRYFTGEASKVAFSIKDEYENPLELSGALYSPEGTFVDSVYTKHCGMGVLSINSPESCYYIIAKSPSNERQRFDLPNPDTSGAVITLNNVGNRVALTVKYRNLPGSVREGMVVKLSSNNLVYFSKEIANSGQIFILDKGKLPQGINCADICNSRDSVISRRLFFIYDRSKPNISISTNKSSYDKRERVEVRVSASDGNLKPLSGSFSVSVTNLNTDKQNPDSENLYSFTMLSSHLSEEVIEPGYYFNDNNPDKERYMDLLMMTSALRNFSPETTSFEREYSQSISGRVTGMFNRAVKNKVLMAYAPSINLKQAYILNDSRFKIEGLDFPDSTSFLLATSGKNGGQLYSLEIDEERFPTFARWHRRLPDLKRTAIPGSKDSLIKSGSEENGVTKRNLKEIYVKGEKYNTNPRYNPSPYLHTFNKTQLKTRTELQEFDHMMITDYLVVTFPGLYKSGDILYSTRGNTLNGPTEPALFVDNMQWTSTELLFQYGMQVQDAENIAYLRGNSASLFKTSNGAILITTRRGRGLEKKSATNIRKIYPLGYQPEKRFSAPNYKSYERFHSPIPDYRRTLYWNPGLTIDLLGVSIFDFYTDDKENQLNIKIEGFFSDGTPFSKSYTVN